MTAEELYHYLRQREVRTRGRPRDFNASCPTPAHKRGDLNPSVHVWNRGNRFRVHCHFGCDGYDVLRGWGLDELAEKMEQAEAFRRALEHLPAPATRDWLGLSLVSFPSGTPPWWHASLVARLAEARHNSRPLTQQFREDVMRVCADLLAHRHAYHSCGCRLAVVYATAYCAERMEWVEGPGRPDKKRASRALRWLEEEGFVTSERTGRSKCYEVVARSPRSASTPDLLPSVSGTETNGARAKVFGEPSAGHADEDISKPSVDEFECLQRGDLDWGDGRDGLGERELDARLEREL